MSSYTYLGTGRHRAVFRRGSVVVKIPINEEGFLANHREALEYERGKVTPRFIPVARCKQLKNGWLVMVYVEYAGRSHNLPVWVDFVDGRQVGLTRHGELVAFDL